MTTDQSRCERLVKAFTDSIGINAIIAPAMARFGECKTMGFYVGNPYSQCVLDRIQSPIIYGRDEHDVWRQMLADLLESFGKTETELEVLADISGQGC